MFRVLKHRCCSFRNMLRLIDKWSKHCPTEEGNLELPNTCNGELTHRLPLRGQRLPDDLRRSEGSTAGVKSSGKAHASTTDNLESRLAIREHCFIQRHPCDVGVTTAVLHVVVKPVERSISLNTAVYRISAIIGDGNQIRPSGQKRIP